MHHSSSSIVNLVHSVVREVIEPAAATVDREGTFPHQGLDALGRAGLLGLISAKEMGGLGGTLRDAAEVVELVGQACASTGMVLCMHYCGTAIIEQHGPAHVRRDIAKGAHVTTLALSEVGSRSHF